MRTDKGLQREVQVRPGWLTLAGVAELRVWGEDTEPGVGGFRSAGDGALPPLPLLDRRERSGGRMEDGEATEVGAAPWSMTVLKNCTEASVEAAASFELSTSVEEEAAGCGDKSGASS